MATAADQSTLDCPVCGENFKEPKLLVCNHVVCKKCIMNWLRKAGQSGGCPLCRAPILSPPPAPQDDLEGLVDALPTDLVLVAKVETEQVLTSSNVCKSCDANLAAISFCLQCRMKLCTNCTKVHKRIPALRSHVTEDLNQLTAERVAAAPRVRCQSHNDRLPEMFCSTHGLLICSLCSSTTHCQCPVQLLHQAAVEKRQELKRQIQGLRDSEKRLKTQVQQSKDKVADMRRQAKKVFDDLQQCVERQRQQVENRIQVWEDEMGLSHLQQLRADITSQAAVLENLLQSAAEDALMTMQKDMSCRVEQLKERESRTDSMHDPACVDIDCLQLTQITQMIAALGQQGPPSPPPPPTSSAPLGRSATSTSTTTTPRGAALAGQQGASPPPPPPTSSTPPGRSATSRSTTTTPRGAALARVLKEGDRVKVNRDYHWPSWYMGLQGTVTAIPSRRATSRGRDPTGCVDVMWGNGDTGYYRMGKNGQYHLDLV